MAKKRRIRTHAPKVPKNEGKMEESTYHKVKRHHKERAEKQAKMRGETKKQEFDSIAHLHGALGNKKVTELHRTGKLMAMLKMSRPGDRYEREADQIASQVMNTNPGTVHENSSAKVAPKVDLSKVNKKKGTTTTTQIKNLSGGEKLDGSTKKFFKSRFDGLDLSKVNIHKGRKANNMANSINARAFTYGNNIVFNKGEYKPNTFQGKKLLAHELAHVAQQTGAQPKKFSRKIKMDEPGQKVNAGNITDADRQNALKNFEGRNKYSKTTAPSPKIAKKQNNITKIEKTATKVDKPPIIKEESVNRIRKSEARSAAPPVKVSSTQGKVVQGWWGKKKDDDKEKEEEDKDGKKPKGIGGFAWWAFKNLLGLIGIDVDQFTAILSKAGDALGAIIKDPKGFFGNLGKAVKGGINNFVKNFKKHLMNGIAGWLFGQLGDAGLEMPGSFDFKGILSIILQVIGLTYNNIRGQIIKGLGKGGEEMMSHAEGMFEHLKTAITEGPMALWEQLKEHLAGLKDQFFGMIIDWVKSTVIQQGVMFLISMLNPAGAIVQAVRAIIKIVTFFMERWQQIQDFASSVVDSVSLIAKGDVTSAQNGVENSLAKAMPITISFIAKLVGLGGISKHIKKVIKKIQKPINNAIKKVTGKIAKKIKALPIFKKGKDAVKKGKKAVEKGKKKLNDAKESVDKAIDDKGKKMRKNIEDGRADKQKKKEDEVKEKNRKGKDAHDKDKKGSKEEDKKKHKVYASEIVQKLKADKGNNAKDFKEFHASKVKLAKDLEGRYQNKLKKGKKIDITITPLEKDKKDNDVDYKINIGPGSAKESGAVKFKGSGDLDIDIPVINFVDKAGEKHKLWLEMSGKDYVLMVASKVSTVKDSLKKGGEFGGIEDQKEVKALTGTNKIERAIKVLIGFKNTKEVKQKQVDAMVDKILSDMQIVAELLKTNEGAAGILEETFVKANLKYVDANIFALIKEFVESEAGKKEFETGKKVEKWDKFIEKVKKYGPINKIDDAPLDISHEFGKEAFNKQAIPVLADTIKELKANEDESNRKLIEEHDAAKNGESWLRGELPSINSGGEGYGQKIKKVLQGQMFDTKIYAETNMDLRNRFIAILKPSGHGFYKVKKADGGNANQKSDVHVFEGTDGSTIKVTLDRECYPTKVEAKNIITKEFLGLEGTRDKNPVNPVQSIEGDDLEEKEKNYSDPKKAKVNVRNMKLDYAHILADLFGGSGEKDAYNIALTSVYYNRTLMKEQEMNIAKDFKGAITDYGAIGIDIDVEVEYYEYDNDKSIDAIVNSAMNGDIKKLKEFSGLSEGSAEELKSKVKGMLVEYFGSDYSKYKKAGILPKRCKSVKYDVKFKLQDGSEMRARKKYGVKKADVWLGFKE